MLLLEALSLHANALIPNVSDAFPVLVILVQDNVSVEVAVGDIPMDVPIFPFALNCQLPKI